MKLNTITLISTLIACTIIAITYISIFHKYYHAFDNKTFKYGAFAFHPVSMVVAFCFITPISSLSFKTFKHNFGFSHQKAKLIHGVGHLLSFTIGLIGVTSMWKTHGDKQEQHLQSMHSWFGILCLVLYGLQIVVAFVVFVLPISKNSRSVFKPIHLFIGKVLTFSPIIVVILGSFSLVYRVPKPNAPGNKDAWFAINMASIAAALLICMLGYQLSKARPNVNIVAVEDQDDYQRLE